MAAPADIHLDLRLDQTTGLNLAKFHGETYTFPGAAALVCVRVGLECENMACDIAYKEPIVEPTDMRTIATYLNTAADHIDPAVSPVVGAPTDVHVGLRIREYDHMPMAHFVGQMATYDSGAVYFLSADLGFWEGGPAVAEGAVLLDNAGDSLDGDFQIMGQSRRNDGVNALVGAGQYTEQGPGDVVMGDPDRLQSYNGNEGLIPAGVPVPEPLVPRSATCSPASMENEATSITRARSPSGDV